MRVLVTGGAGFIGSHIVDALIARGAQTAVLDNLSTGRFENIDPRVNFYKGDLRDEKFVRDTLRSEKPDYVIHHAAQIDVQTSVDNPAADAAINIMGTINLLEACRACAVRKIIYASSAAVYGNPRYLPVDEKHPVHPLSGYGVSKHTVEHYLAVYQALYGLDYTALRYANVYGPRQDATGEGGVVAIFTDRLLRGQRCRIYGDGKQTRDFVFVGDVARANLAALEADSAAGSGVYNISTGLPTSVNELYNILREITGSGLEPEYCPPRAGDIEHSYLDERAAATGLKWRATRTLVDGLRDTVEYYKQTQD
ncbi:SDR family oxidoreductase [Desulfallas thermosapovorans]|uniref:UDP-glucose 4-epimerase n=1 Tax=Desulfallas thermosapovorans DSM 6562 TaxID=1121431 RepID=A0A5S4ZPZ1_9FIRM|nr:SDR family oxidoreductase [Desulfallas thermosapovorans]TYO94798.1 UDP-glucose 4-epimerase [Desulfallas thermosapovorans DSM 6562]